MLIFNRQYGLSLDKENQSRYWFARILTRQTQYVLDLTVLTVAFALAYLFRFDFEVPKQYVHYIFIQLPYVVLIQFATLLLAGVYTFIWRYISIVEIKSFLKAALWSSLPILLMRLGLPERVQELRIPLSIVIVDTILAFSGVLAIRVLRRALYERYEKQDHRVKYADVSLKPILLIGAGRAGVMVAKEILGRRNTDLDIKGFLDDDQKKLGAIIQGIKVLGSTKDLPCLVSKYGINHVVISIANASRSEFLRLLDVCKQIPVKVQVIPGLTEILQGRVKVSRIRDVQVEDLLGREPINLDNEAMKQFLAGKVVMVTGAGGSIGAELARQVARFHPHSLLLVERTEFALFNIDRELRQLWPELSFVPLIADVGDEKRMRYILATYKPHVILHAAAHKHVPMMEGNSTEAIRNNVLATQLLGDMAGKFGVAVFVLISTDKAVRPTSIMGASKRVAELVVQNLNNCYETVYLAVRFGNVIGSTGSVIPLFHEQIRMGGPVTVTHPDMVRYFMTISEAAQLVLQASAIGQGGEIFVLDMGEPVRILDIAKEVITLTGLKPYEDIDIVFTGMRPGEKLFEELGTTSEQVSKTRYKKIYVGNIAAYPEQEVYEALARLRYLAEGGREQELREFLNQLLPEAQLVSHNVEEEPGYSLAAASA